MFCALCGAEYRSGVAACAACRTPLSHRLPNPAAGEPPDPARDVLVPIYEGLTPLAELLREALAKRGIGSMVRLAEPQAGLFSPLAPPEREQVLISAWDRIHRLREVEECLTLVTEVPADPDE